LVSPISRRIASIRPLIASDLPEPSMIVVLSLSI
jgi:hypothetical protein